MAATSKLAFLASDAAKAQEALKRLVARYGNVPIEKASAIVALGGDGFMLESLHRYMGLKKPLYGMQRGSIGFLMNAYDEDHLRRRVATAQGYKLHPLRMRVLTLSGNRDRGARDQRGLASARDAAECEDPHRGRRRHPLGRAHLRRHPGCHPRRQHRL